MKQDSDRRGIVDRLRRAAIILERDHFGGLESAGRRIVDVAGEIGKLIAWKGEGFNFPTGSGFKIIKVDGSKEPTPIKRANKEKHLSCSTAGSPS